MAYEKWRASGFGVLSTLVGNSHQHWLHQANRILDDYKAGQFSSTITDEQLESFQPMFTV